MASIHHFVNGFRACLNFINDVTCMQLFFSAAGVETSAQFTKALESNFDLPNMPDVYSMKACKWRQDAEVADVGVVEIRRDVPLENALPAATVLAINKKRGADWAATTVSNHDHSILEHAKLSFDHDHSILHSQLVFDHCHSILDHAKLIFDHDNAILDASGRRYGHEETRQKE